MSDELYAIVELMGRKIVAGKISRDGMLYRVDVPATSTFPPFTQLYGEAAIYCITYVSEEVALLTAENLKVNPISVYNPDLVTKEMYLRDVKALKGELFNLRNPELTDGKKSGVEEDNDDDD